MLAITLTLDRRTGTDRCRSVRRLVVFRQQEGWDQYIRHATSCGIGDGKFYAAVEKLFKGERGRTELESASLRRAVEYFIDNIERYLRKDPALELLCKLTRLAESGIEQRIKNVIALI